jgi:exosome complex component RRP42
MASPAFEEGPPRADAIELARVVDRCIREGKALDFKKLKISDSDKAWFAFIDIYVANYDGNLFDASALAALSALKKARVPKLEKNKEEIKIVKGEFEGSLEIERLPILTTSAKILNQIVADPDLAEEKAMSARLSVATTEDNYISALQKGGAGYFSEEELCVIVDRAFQKAKEWRKFVQ